MATPRIRTALLRAAALLSMVLASLLVGHTHPGQATSDSTVYGMEAEAMTRVGATSLVTDSAASGGVAVQAWTSGSGVSGNTTFSTTGPYTFTFGGREDYYSGTDGAHAHIGVYLDGASTPAGGVYMTNTSGYPAYSISVSVSAGTHSFALLFDNDAYGGSSSTDRNAYLDHVAITAPAATATSTPVPSTNTPFPTSTFATSTPVSPTSTPPPPATPTGVAHAASIYYVNCSASTNGNGTQTSPWNSLAPVSSFAFNPGDTVLFSRGTTCVGSLQLQRSGTNGSPITLDAYGTGANPVIDGTGQQAAVQLTNTSYVTVQNLEIKSSTRWGLYATTSVKGVVAGITLRDLTVDHVAGGTLDQKWTGLVVFAPGLLGSRFDHVLIDAVTAYSTAMWSGIMVYGTQITGDQAWTTDAQDISQHSTNITIQKSTVHDTYGDGIVCYMCNGATLQNNVVYRSGLQPAPVTIGTPNALWTWASNNTIVQFNEAYDNHSPGVDGGAYDIDYYSHNATVQYNYAHDNQAYCVSAFGANNATTTRAIIRYNVCSNNGTKGSGSGAEEIYIKTWNSGKLSDLEIYNNTIYTAEEGAVGTDNTTPAFVSGTPLIFENNLVVATVPNVLGAGMTRIPFTRDYNLYYDTRGSFTGTEAHSIYNRSPLLNSLGYDGVGRPTTQWTLQSGSAAINAGTSVCNGRSGCSVGTQDFYGHAIPLSGAFDIGADEAQ